MANCVDCGKNIEKSWKYCPHCGFKLRRGIFDFFHDSFFNFKDFNRRMEGEIEKEMRDFQAVDLRPFFGPGVKVRIQQIPMREPQVIEETTQKYRVSHRKLPKITEEPKTSVKQTGNSVIVQLDLPGVDSEKDIELELFESSIEIRAYSKDKGYFKILAIPQSAQIVRRELTKGKLYLELAK